MHRLTVLILLLSFWLPAIITVQAEPLTLAVLDLEAKGISQNEASVLSDKLRAVLISTRKYRVIERKEMDEILKEQGFQQSGTCDESSCHIQMGKILGVRNIVTGSVGKVGRTFSITAKLIKVANGEIENVVSRAHVGSIDKLLTQEMEIVGNTLAGINTRKAGSPNSYGKKLVPVITGAVGIASGIFAGLSAKKWHTTQTDYEKATDLHEQETYLGRGKTEQTKAIIFGGLAAASIPITIILLKESGTAPESATNSATSPSLHIHPAGIAVSFTF